MITMTEFTQFLKTRYQNDSTIASFDGIEELQTFAETRTEMCKAQIDSFANTQITLEHLLYKNFDLLNKACADSSADAIKANEFYKKLKLYVQQPYSSEFKSLFDSTVVSANKF